MDLIGNTPMVEARRLDTGPCRLFLKLENQNPGGSIKDRVALAMIDAAERERRLAPAGLLVEATAGNTGLGLALVAGQKGYRLLIVVPDKMSQTLSSVAKTSEEATGAEGTDSSLQGGDIYAEMTGGLPPVAPWGMPDEEDDEKID